MSEVPGIYWLVGRAGQKAIVVKEEAGGSRTFLELSPVGMGEGAMPKDATQLGQGLVELSIAEACAGA